MAREDIIPYHKYTIQRRVSPNMIYIEIIPPKKGWMDYVFGVRAIHCFGVNKSNTEFVSDEEIKSYTEKAYKWIDRYIEMNEKEELSG